jgi:hypothetical protein
MAISAEITAAIVAAICALAIDEIHELEKKDSFRVAVAADVRADLNLIRSERAFEPAALFDANSSPLTTWDRMAPRVGDLPETAVEPVAIFYSRLRSIIGIRPSDSVKMLEWRQGMSATMTACGLWALERLEGDNHSGWYREWVKQLQDVQSTLREDESTCVALLNPSRNP